LNVARRPRPRGRWAKVNICEGKHKTSKAFFSEEKKQKTFTSGAHGQIQAMAGKLEAAQK